MTEARSAIRLGIVGTGYIANTVMPALRSIPSIDVVAVSSRSLTSAESFGRTWSVPNCFESTDEMLARAEIDTVYIATPPATHAPLAISALRTGRDVIVEKPFALDAEESRLILEWALRERRFLAEAMWMAYNPAVRQIRALVQDGAVGSVTHLRADFGLDLPADHLSRTSGAAGGALLEMGVYTIAFAQLLLGPHEAMTASGAIASGGFDVTSTAFLSYAGGATATLTSSIAENIPVTASVEGGGGTLHVADPFIDPPGYEIVGRRGELVAKTEVPRSGYQPMFEQIAASICSGSDHTELWPPSASVDVMTTLDSVRRAVVEESDD